MKRIFDASGDIVSVVEHDELEDRTTFARFQNTDPVIEENKKLATLNDGYNKKRDLRRVASVPVVVMEKWCRDDGVNLAEVLQGKHKKWLRTKLYDVENQYLLTAPHKR